MTLIISLSKDLRAYCEKKVGKLTFPDAILGNVSCWLTTKTKGEEFVDKNYEQSIKELTWHLIKEQLAQAHGIKVDDNDVRECTPDGTCSVCSIWHE